jgi:hypothetical protein
MTRRQAGLLLAVAQVALVSSLGLKLLVDRARFPRAWARTLPFDPSTPIRGRYVRLGLVVPLVSTPAGEGDYSEHGVRLQAVNGKLSGTIDDSVRSPRVQLRREGMTTSARLAQPIAYFIPEHMRDPSVRSPGEELWVEVTIPGKGAPRPIRLGVMKGGTLTPIEVGSRSESR